MRKGLVVALLGATSCSVVSRTVGTVTGSTQKEEMKSKLAILQSQVMRFADVYVTVIGQAAASIDARTPEERLTVVGWRLRQATAAYDIASGSNPSVNAIDMAAHVTLTRLVVERYWIPRVFQESGRPLLEQLRRLEPRAWKLVPADEAEVRNAREQIGAWLDTHPDVHEVAGLRTVDLTSESRTPGGQGSPADILGALGLGGLDPAVQQIDQSRILAERALYYAKRWPMLLDLQTQQMALELSLQPASKQVLIDADRVSRAAESMGNLADTLPDLVDRQREAAIRQAMDGLQAQGKKAQDLLIHLKGALDSGKEAADSVDRATASIRSLMATTSPAPGAPPRKPFDVDDYTRALEELRKTTSDLRILVESLDHNAPRVQALVDHAVEQASSRGEALADHVFRRAIALIGVLLGGILAVSLAYRWFSARVRDGVAPRPSIEARTHSR